MDGGRHDVDRKHLTRREIFERIHDVNTMVEISKIQNANIAKL